MSESIQSKLISALPAATKVSDTDIVVLENGSTTQKITIAQLKEALGINALNTNFKFYSSLSQIGLTASATWDQILIKLADGTGIKFAAWKSSNRQLITVCRLYSGYSTIEVWDIDNNVRHFTAHNGDNYRPWNIA